jgi:hypothetical protein
MGVEEKRVSWDPYEVWSTRVRGTPVGGSVGKALPPGGNNWPVARGASGRPEVSRRSISSLAVAWAAFALAVALGLTVFGVMTPTARVAHILLGVAALYCAVKIVARRRTGRVFGRIWSRG